MLYKLTKNFHDIGSIVKIISMDTDMCVVEDIFTGETAILFTDWIEEYIINKGECCDV